LVEDDQHFGSSVAVVLLDSAGTVVAQALTTVGG
jgi:hypothetical protein